MIYRPTPIIKYIRFIKKKQAIGYSVLILVLFLLFFGVSFLTFKYIHAAGSFLGKLTPAQIVIYSIIEMLVASLCITVRVKFENQFLLFNRLAGMSAKDLIATGYFELLAAGFIHFTCNLSCLLGALAVAQISAPKLAAVTLINFIIYAGVTAIYLKTAVGIHEKEPGYPELTALSKKTKKKIFSGRLKNLSPGFLPLKLLFLGIKKNVSLLIFSCGFALSVFILAKFLLTQEKPVYFAASVFSTVCLVLIITALIQEYANMINHNLHLFLPLSLFAYMIQSMMPILAFVVPLTSLYLVLVATLSIKGFIVSVIFFLLYPFLIFNYNVIWGNSLRTALLSLLSLMMILFFGFVHIAVAVLFGCALVIISYTIAKTTYKNYSWRKF